MTNRLTPEALDALLAEHQPAPDFQAEYDNCTGCTGTWPCSVYLLASEVRDARDEIQEWKEWGNSQMNDAVQGLAVLEQTRKAMLEGMKHAMKFDDAALHRFTSAWLATYATKDGSALAHYEEEGMK